MKKLLFALALTGMVACNNHDNNPDDNVNYESETPTNQDDVLKDNNPNKHTNGETKPNPAHSIDSSNVNSMK